ncbi:hypothetical protein [Bradyrhizobium sp.]|uniref:hypothetical protein n=1 Tax=Bradyrhizobium sp. TaxID=376 RepID=UPI003C3EBCA6
MSTASIEFLIVAPGAGGITARLARGIKRMTTKRAPLPIWASPPRHTTSHRRSNHARSTGMRSLAQRSGTDRSSAENITDEIGAEPGASVNAGRHGTAISTTAEKRPRGYPI